MYTTRQTATLARPLLPTPALSSDAAQALCGCLNAHQCCLDWETLPHFDYDLIMAGLDSSLPRLTIMRLLSAVRELQAAGLINPIGYHFRLSLALTELLNQPAAAVATTESAQ